MARSLFPRIPRVFWACLLCCGTVAALAARAPGKLIVHEWGTFTALQNEKGDALPGINIDDEPLPPFVHQLNSAILPPAHAVGQFRENVMKGLPPGQPFVTMRLETPVMYFYPPHDAKLPLSLDVEVALHGGWLTEYYPQAKVVAPGYHADDDPLGPITADTIGKLTWHNVQIGATAAGPKTDAHVWLAPRQVKAVGVTVPPQSPEADESESESYLFYRGVGNRPVPLRAVHDEQKQMLSISGQRSGPIDAIGGTISGAWLVHVRADQTVAYRTLPPFELPPNDPAPVASLSSAFSPGEYSAGNFQSLRSDMHAALVRDGLFPDEATAMLDTWQRAYFKSPGLRLFFLVPRTWTDAVMPLTLSQPAEVQRVMMGRLELISPEQRKLLKKLASQVNIDSTWIGKIPNSPNRWKFWSGHSDFGDLGVPIPEDYQTYLALGRFRNALVLAEQQARPTPQLKRFIAAYGLYSYSGRK